MPRSVPTLPGFPSAPCRISTASAAFLWCTRSTVPGRPWAGLSPAFTWIRSSRHCLLDTVSLSPKTDPLQATSTTGYPGAGIGSKEGVAPSSALRSRASPIRGTRLQQHESGWRPDSLAAAGAWPPLVTCLGWRPLVDDILNCPRIWPGAVAGLRAAACNASLYTWTGQHGLCMFEAASNMLAASLSAGRRVRKACRAT